MFGLDSSVASSDSTSNPWDANYSTDPQYLTYVREQDEKDWAIQRSIQQDGQKVAASIAVD